MYSAFRNLSLVARQVAYVADWVFSHHKTAKNMLILMLGLLLSMHSVMFTLGRTATAETTYPTAPTKVCGVASILNGPATAPAGAIVVPAGNNEGLTPNWKDDGFSASNKVFWFAPGVHTLGSDQFSQIQPGSGSTYIGAPGAIIDGQGKNENAFTGNASNVTIKYLTIRNFVTPHDQGAVNHDFGKGWTISNNTMTNNAGAAVFGSTDNVLSYNCLKDNGQYGFQTGASSGTPTNILLDHNEIAGNNTANTEETAGWDGCGCSGGGKFWASEGVTVTNNYVHDNKGIGLWADTLNVGFLFENNWIENNDGPGIMYEVSYNFAIRNNVFKHNATVEGPTNPGFPTGAIYVSESGSDSRVTSAKNNFSQASDITNNLFVDNWSGVVLWENANRFCSQGLPTSECTLVNPSTITVSSCKTALADPARNKQGMTPDYFNDCRWLTKNVKVHDNLFQLTKANVAGCDVNKACGLNAVFSNYGSTKPYTSSVIPTNIAFNQGNDFYKNTYQGPWFFMSWAQSNQHYPLTFADWQKPVTDKCTTPDQVSSGTCNSGFGQDEGSTYNGDTPVPMPPTNPTEPTDPTDPVTPPAENTDPEMPTDDTEAPANSDDEADTEPVTDEQPEAEVPKQSDTETEGVVESAKDVELPSTGIESVFSGILGSSALAYSTATYVRSRRSLRPRHLLR